jgi:DNA-binding PadR family transcriptional regulator
MENYPGKLASVLGRHWCVLVKLYDREMYGTELADALGKKLPAISKATKELKEVGLIDVRFSPQKRGGVRRYYHLTERGRVIVEVILKGRQIPERREYTEAEVKMLATHGRQFKDSILYLLERRYGRRYDYNAAMRWMPNLESHLRTGYPEVYRLYDDCKKLREEMSRLREEMKHKVEKRFEESFADLLGSLSPDDKEGVKRRIAEGVVERANDRLRGYEATVRERDEAWDFIDGVILYRGTRLLDSARRENLGELRNFVIETSDELMKDYRKILELENVYYEKQKALEKELDDRLLKGIESDLPLRGRCRTCEDIPRIVRSKAD